MNGANKETTMNEAAQKRADLDAQTWDLLVDLANLDVYDPDMGGACMFCGVGEGGQHDARRCLHTRAKAIVAAEEALG